jgi:nucleoside-diphosphate-sugar epimerase
MTVLVTGASGFIGNRLVRRLVAEQIEVRGTHRRAAPAPIAGVRWWPLQDLESPAALAAAVAGCEAVVHLAALAHQPGRRGVGRLAEFVRVNAEGTRLLAHAAGAADVRRFVLVSSVGAICTSSDATVDDRTPSTPGDDYGHSKLRAERALVAELRNTPVDWCILRPPLVYGPEAPGNVRRLLRLIASGLPLPFGAIRNRRSFIFVDNLVDAIVAVLRHPQPIRSSYVLSDGSDFTTPELVRALAAAAGVKARLLRWPPALLRLGGRAGDVANLLLGTAVGFDSYSIERLSGSLAVDGTRFRMCFNWQPPVGREEALRLTCADTGAGHDDLMMNSGERPRGL